jgi:hypothetical protein
MASVVDAPLLIDGDAGRDGRATVARDPDMADRGCARRQIHDDRIAVEGWESETDGIGAERRIDPAGRMHARRNGVRECHSDEPGARDAFDMGAKHKNVAGADQADGRDTRDLRLLDRHIDGKSGAHMASPAVAIDLRSGGCLSCNAWAGTAIQAARLQVSDDGKEMVGSLDAMATKIGFDQPVRNDARVFRVATQGNQYPVQEVAQDIGRHGDRFQRISPQVLSDIANRGPIRRWMMRQLDPLMRLFAAIHRSAAAAR